MKYTILALICTFAFAGAAFAADQEIDSDGVHQTAPVPSGKALSAADLAARETSPDQFLHGYWHCTAYAEGHGHDWGYDYRDVHYNHAYYGAMRRCEAATHHHCHDVHCHYDHH